VLAIHTEEARALPGVVGVFTAEDIPGQNKVGHLVKDWDTMIAVGDITHYLGDAICLVAAETPEILAQAKALVKVDYEELPMVRSPREAMLPDAPLVHRTGNLLTHKHIQRGNPAEAIAKSKHVLTQHFSTPWTEHAFLEPECAVAFPYKDGVKVYTSDQGVYDTRKEISIMLGWEPECIVVENKLVGGGFGGKEDVSVQHLAVLAALILGGVEVPFEKGLLGHSDADVLAHAVMDAVLGAAALGDIGKHFPDTDPAYAGADSLQLAQHVARIMREKGWKIVNIDSTLLCQKPKLAPYIPAMRENLAAAFGMPVDAVSVKATTEEHLGFTGEGLGIAAHAVALIEKL